MKMAALTAATALLGDAALAQPQSTPRPSGPVQQRIAPGLAAYTDEVLFGKVWPGPGLSPRDRSLVVISVLIASNKPTQLQGHLDRALGIGITPAEASGVLTHLALYAGWPSAVSALAVYDEVYNARKVDLGSLEAARPALTVTTAAPLDPASAAFAPGFAQLDQQVVQRDLWRRSDLNLRDRSLVTIAALAAMGDADQLPAYLRQGVEAGLTQAQIAEAMTQLAFYAGWPKATKAIEVAAATLARTPIGVTASQESDMKLQRGGSVAPRQGPAETFTGSVTVEAPFQAEAPARASGATVTFQPGARTFWHSHPLGQTLIVTAGVGWTQCEGAPKVEIRAGDIVWCPCQRRHWHGATATSAMTHIAITEVLDGKVVDWMEPVTDEQYLADLGGQ